MVRSVCAVLLFLFFTATATAGQDEPNPLLDRAQSERWLTVAVGRDVVAWIDRRTVERTGDRRFRAWFRWDWLQDRSTERTYPTKKWNFSIDRTEVDCALLRTRVFDRVLYHTSAPESVDTVSLDPEKAKWNAVIPDSVGEAAYVQACKVLPTLVGK